jgi:hypothetical protein
MSDPQPIRFVISCAARTGSTMLVHLLRSHPRIVCHGEVFERRRIGHLAGRYGALRQADETLDAELWRQRTGQPAEFLRDVVFDSQGLDVVGFKFKTDEAFARPWADIQALVARDTSIRVIRLRRRDLLGQFVSHQVVLEQGAKTLIVDGERPHAARAFAPRPAAVLSYVVDVMRRERLADAAYGQHPQLVVWYEDLADERTHAQLADFLHVPARRLTTTTRKILSDNRSLISNLAAVLEGLQDGGFAGGYWPAP